MSEENQELKTLKDIDVNSYFCNLLKNVFKETNISVVKDEFGVEINLGKDIGKNRIEHHYIDFNKAFCDLRQEAIKWINFWRKDSNISKDTAYGTIKLLNNEKINVFMEFFNITEEDLKQEVEK